MKQTLFISAILLASLSLNAEEVKTKCNHASSKNIGLSDDTHPPASEATIPESEVSEGEK